GAPQDRPWSIEYVTNACSLPSPRAPSHQLRTASLVAPAPVGAPLAMSAIGKLSVRAPAMPSNVTRPLTGSKAPQSVTSATARGFSKLTPPSKDLARYCTPAPFRLPSQKTYTTPSLSVRTVQP